MLRPPLPAALYQRLPSPSRWIALLDARIPLTLKKKLLEPRLNRLFREALQEDEFELLEGRYLSLVIQDLGIHLTLTMQQQHLRLCENPPETTIRGDWRAMLQLALRKEDPDGLFFRRQLVIEGDTELGLGIKNLLDSLDWSLDQGWLGRVLHTAST
jgi:predicted lipid carrier protein YhbT